MLSSIKIMLARLSGDLSGVAAVEFAIVGPFLFALFFAVINLGDLAWTYSTLHDAASVAARYAAVQQDVLSNGQTPSCFSTASIQTVFDQHAAGPINTAQMPTISVYWGGTLSQCNPSGAQSPNQVLMSTTLPGGDVLVSTQYSWQPIAMAGIFPTINLRIADIEFIMGAKS